MKDINNFYYKLLNINQKETNIEPIIARVINFELQTLLSQVKEVDGFCMYLTCNIGETLTKAGVNISYQNISDILNIDYVHHFLIANTIINDEIKYYLIDPSYTQFLKKEKHLLTDKFKEWPGEVLKTTILGQKVLEKLVKDGYTMIDEIGMQLYLGSFINESDIRKIDFKLDSTITNGKRFQ